jgi:hypothetical protein
MSDSEELRALVREVIRDVLPQGLAVTETVNLSTDEDLAVFVKRLLDLDPGQREELRSGLKRFRLASPQAPSVPSAPVRRIERGAVTEAVIAAAAGAGERLVLGRGAVLTPLARDRARASGVQIEKER